MAFSLVKNQILAYAFVALIIVCIIASIFTMSFGLFFATIAVAITVYAVYRMKLEEQKRLNAQDLEQSNQDQIQEQEEQSQDSTITNAFAPSIVQAPPARLVTGEAEDNEQDAQGKQKKKKRAMRAPTAEEVEYARKLSKQQARQFSRVHRRRQMQGQGQGQGQGHGNAPVSRPDMVRTATDISMGRPSDPRCERKFFNKSKKQLHVRRKKPNRRPDSSGYAQLASFRWDHSKSLSENAGTRLMRAGAILPEPKHARRRLWNSVLRDYPLKLAPGMVRVPKSLDLKPCKWRK